MTRQTDKNRRNLYIKQEDYDYLAQIGNGYADGLRKAVEAHKAVDELCRRILSVVHPHPSEDTERYREEIELVDLARSLLAEIKRD